MKLREVIGQLWHANHDPYMMSIMIEPVFMSRDLGQGNNYISWDRGESLEYREWNSTGKVIGFSFDCEIQSS